MIRRDSHPPYPVSMDWHAIRNRLIGARRRAGLSMYHLGVQLGCSKSQVCEWENGNHTPSVSSLIRWARVLDMRMALIGTGENDDAL